MIAQLAKALHDRDKAIADPVAERLGRQHSLAAWDDTPEIARECWYDEARVALAAMREPTAPMIQSGGEVTVATDLAGNSPEGARECWVAMIDAALAEDAAKHD